MATAKNATSHHIARAAVRHSPKTRATHVAPTDANSGPTTIAPTTRTAESVMTAIAASVIARKRKRK